MKNIVFFALLLGFVSLFAAEGEKSLIIVTTTNIVANSQTLENFIADKRARGFTVLLATETDYGGENLKGIERAQKIREWLKTVHEDYSYLLLIGDANAKYGDVPMWIVWPRHSYSNDECGGFALDCRYFETDALYGNLTGDWDLNKNGQYGEHELDEGDSGMSFAPQLAVGRIPVYFDDTEELDIILQHAIDYGNQTEEQAIYRKKVLLPASFYYFKGQKMTTYTWPYTLDGAQSADWIHQNYLSDDDVSVTTMYEEEGFVISEYESTFPIKNQTLIEKWEDGFGLIMWFGHGLPKMVIRTVWVDDENSDGAAQSSEMDSPLMIDSTSVFNGSFSAPGFVVTVSCEVGSVEVPENLTHTMLLKGAAVGVLSSTNVTPLDSTDYSDYESELDIQRFSENNAGALMFEGLLEGESAAFVYSRVREQVGLDGSIEALAGKMMINYYGDPTLTLYDTVDDKTEDEPDEKESDSSGCSVLVF
ncbi:hypothetical protein KAH37_04510 [bacterium]|nr:hypothetical protein [bacterium]